VVGVTPQSNCDATVVYGTKSSANMEWKYDDNWNFISGPPQLYYASDQYSACNNLTLEKGRDLAELDMERYNQVCVLGSQAASTFFGTIDPVGKSMQFNGVDFTVVGVYAPRLTGENAGGSNMDNIIILPYTARRVLGGEAPTEFVVKARDAESLMEAGSRIRGFLKGLVGENNFWTDSDDQWLQSANEQMGMISMVLGGIAAISLLVGGIGIMNIMLVTVTERTREIGIRRAIGAQRSSIVAQFLIEAAMLCGIGGVIGIGLGSVGSYIVGRLMFQMTIYPSPWITACAFGFSVALGIVFGIYPAVKAARLLPVEALRAE
jgi:putative ABC transport system permease protein